jgi:hypothetical protein
MRAMTAAPTTVVFVLVPLAVVIGALAAWDPETVLGTALGALWCCSLGIVLYLIGRRSLRTPWMIATLFGGVIYRVPVSLAHLFIGFIVFKGEVDFRGYSATATTLSKQMMDFDFSFLHLESSEGMGGWFVTLLIALAVVVIGPSLPGLVLFSGMVGAVGSYLFVRALQMRFSDHGSLRFGALALFFFPSLAFWTSLLGKDSWVFLFLGWTAYAVARVEERVTPGRLVSLALAVTLVTVVRAYIGGLVVASLLVAFLATMHTRVVWRGTAALLTPVKYAGFIALIAVVGLVTVKLSPISRYHTVESSGSLTEGVLNSVLSAHVGLSSDPNAGGSSLPVAIKDPTITGVLMFLPQGMTTFLFRPFVWEAHNVVALAASMESMALMGVIALRWRSLVAAVRRCRTDFFIVFALAAALSFTALMSVELNFGVIVRHRAMVLPFIFLVLSVPPLRRRAAQRVAAPVPQPA